MKYIELPKITLKLTSTNFKRLGGVGGVIQDTSHGIFSFYPQTFT